MRRRIATIRSVVGLALAGALVGVFLTGFGTQLIGRVSLFSTTELPEARQYMLSYLASDREGLLALSGKVDVVSQAVALANPPRDTGGFKPVAMRFIGGSSVAGEVIQCYVVEYRKEGAPEVLVPYTLTLVDGKVIHVD
ncbi:MAG TPA: hypothetical protein VGJ46_02315 [Candidatus Limnocylindrales bacterium]|jgi:hypothetical protein